MILTGKKTRLYSVLLSIISQNVFSRDNTCYLKNVNIEKISSHCERAKRELRLLWLIECSRVTFKAYKGSRIG